MCFLFIYFFSSQAVQSVNVSHDLAHAQMDVKFRSLVCVGLKWVRNMHRIQSLQNQCKCVLQPHLFLNMFLSHQWTGATPVVGGVVFQHGCSGKMVSYMVVSSQSWMGTDQVWTQASTRLTSLTTSTLWHTLSKALCNDWPTIIVLFQGPIKVCLQSLPRLWASWQERGKSNYNSLMSVLM